MNDPKPKTVEYPEICLAIDNCFASKRYTQPHEWMGLVHNLGLRYVEASADNECDPLYQGEEYLKRWTDQVIRASAEFGVSVCNLYSGHGTYSTLGLGHTDPEVRNRMLNSWVKPMIETAASLDAGLGFFCHAFPNLVLQDPGLYQEYYDELASNLAEAAGFAQSAGCRSIGLEQMYSPHQVPWTLAGSRDLLAKVYGLSGNPLYLTIDTGHQSGQQRFLKPTQKAIEKYIQKMGSGGTDEKIWLGPDSAYRLLENCLTTAGTKELISKMMDEMDTCPHLFATPADGSPYTWLEELGCYSPIIHLQQTDGTSSNHRPFTGEWNRTGIIEAGKVLEAIKKSYGNLDGLEIPRVGRIYLTIEVFASTASINHYTLADLRETVRYWRQWIPEDGMTLDQLI